MKAEELRIGNWVCVSHAFKKQYEVEDYSMLTKINGLGDGFISWDKSYGFYHEGIFPIPLTEKWLVKFGFKPLNGHEFSFWLDEWECLSLYAEPYPKSFAIGLSRGLKDIWSTGKIQNVHQLQNLYFALTGQELTIK
jgi:hypothetical protein